jgi:hypothetical protein
MCKGVDFSPKRVYNECIKIDRVKTGDNPFLLYSRDNYYL